MDDLIITKGVTFPLTSSHRIPYKHVFVETVIGEPGALSTRHPRRAIALADVTQSFLEVCGFMVRWPRTKGTASNERVHSFMDFCLIPLSKTCSFDVPAKNL